MVVKQTVVRRARTRWTPGNAILSSEHLVAVDHREWGGERADDKVVGFH